MPQSQSTIAKPAKTYSTRKNIIQKTIEVGSSTFMSRLLGLAREILTVQFLGAGVLSDAFFTAFKIPNSMRKVFAEGALSAAFIPSFVSILKKGSKEKVSRLMTLSFLVVEGILFLFCFIIFLRADLVIHLFAPGWYTEGFPAEQAFLAISFLRILISFILFLSSSALLAGALQATDHFFVPAFAPVLLNGVFIVGLVIGISFGMSVQGLCYFILFGGFLQFLLHIAVYLRLQFSFLAIDRESLANFYIILKKFIPCFFSMSVMEVNLIISTTIATYLPKGSISLIYYANRFLGIPLGVFAVAFSTILLPYFSRISTYAPKRLSFYLFESAKLIFWVTIPVTLLMGFLSKSIFLTLFLSENFNLEQVDEAHLILITFLAGLFFFSLNKILLNIFYSLHDTRRPVVVSLITALSNYIFCKLLISSMGTRGLALAFVISGIIQMILFYYFLVTRFNFKIYFQKFFEFSLNAVLQMVILFFIFLSIFYIIWYCLFYLPNPYTIFFQYKPGFWLWVVPLIGAFFWAFLKTRTYFNINLYFLDS